MRILPPKAWSRVHLEGGAGGREVVLFGWQHSMVGDEAFLMSVPRSSGLKRPWHEMPDFVRDALVERELMDAYRCRPPYQQNDYVGWITRAKRQETRERRPAQMLDELESGDKYMKMDWHPR